MVKRVNYGGSQTIAPSVSFKQMIADHHEMRDVILDFATDVGSLKIPEDVGRIPVSCINDMGDLFTEFVETMVMATIAAQGRPPAGAKLDGIAIDDAVLVSAVNAVTAKGVGVACDVRADPTTENLRSLLPMLEVSLSMSDKGKKMSDMLAQLQALKNN